MCTLPYLSQLTIDLVVRFHLYFACWDISLVPADICFNNPKAMEKLGQV